MPRLALFLLICLSTTAIADESPRILVTFADPGISNAARGGPARPAYSRRSSPYLVAVNVRRAADRVARDFGLEVVDEWPIIPLRVHCLVYSVGEDTPLEDLLAQLRERPEVESAQRLNTFEVQGSNVDPYANLQHNLDTLELAEAHGVTRGDGAIVAIIDTGADFEHPELAAAIGRGARHCNRRDHRRGIRQRLRHRWRGAGSQAGGTARVLVSERSCRCGLRQLYAGQGTQPCAGVRQPRHQP